MVPNEELRKVQIMATVYQKDRDFIMEKSKKEKRKISVVLTEALEFYVNAQKKLK